MSDETDLREVRLLLEEICCDLCRFIHEAREGNPARSVEVHREYFLGPNIFADVRIAPRTSEPYFVEVKYGYPNDALIQHLRSKYEAGRGASKFGGKVVLVVDLNGRENWPAVKDELVGLLEPGLELEVWDEAMLASLLRDSFGIDEKWVDMSNLLDLRQEVDRAKGYHAFGGQSFADYEHDPLKAELLWQFGCWKLKELREAGHLEPRDILPPGTYRQAATLLADLCSFSSYVRDTPDTEIIRESLTSFYSKSRYEIINRGGMLGGFVGDQVIGFFGIPKSEEGFAEQVLRAARALLDIGQSVSTHWQRRIDRAQSSGGVHVGVALGDLEIISLRPFSRTHIGTIGDSINVAARLMAAASPGEIVVSNSFYQHLPEKLQAKCSELEPVEARNVGRIKAWKVYPDGAAGADRATERL